ncbi:MAG: hypothetical protein QOE27_718 [Solirubrobacteraceae bacterium]|jgi:phage-related protein|nr:hypothetical protein [Solirubrobacteraceae bacterium]MEA2356294.1 hypothetical protein [Solirubrobacteraceae bacterium]
MAPFNRTSRGLPQVVLAILIVWALTAVLLLTGTLINAREIDRRVVYINTQLLPINKHVSYIALAGRTNVIAASILRAATPLAPGLGKTDTLVKSINKTAKSILATARPINTKVIGIGATVTTIHATVGQIHQSVTSIHSLVTGSITPKLQTTGKDVQSISASVNSINSRVKSILSTAQGGIQPAVVSINGKADSILSATGTSGVSNGTQILPDFININTLVGRDPNNPNSINGHANSIDCSRLLNLVGATSFCGKGG